MSAIGNTSIVPFIFNGESVRFLMIERRPWFVAADIRKVLGLVNPTRSCAKLGGHQKGLHPLKTLGGEQSVLRVTEGGVYRLVMRSDKPVAERPRDWLADEVLPSLRRTGSYTMSGATVIPPAEPPEQVRDLNANLRTVTETRQTWGVKSAQQMWLKLGMPTVPAMFEPQQQPTLFELSGQGDAA